MNSFLSAAQSFCHGTYNRTRLLGLMLQRLDRHVLGQVLGEVNWTNTQESTHEGVAHTQASCCDTLTFLTLVQSQEKRSFSTRVNRRRANTTPPASPADPELLSPAQKQTISRELLYFKASFRNASFQSKKQAQFKGRKPSLSLNGHWKVEDHRAHLHLLCASLGLSTLYHISADAESQTEPKGHHRLTPLSKTPSAGHSRDCSTGETNHDLKGFRSCNSPSHLPSPLPAAGLCACGPPASPGTLAHSTGPAGTASSGEGEPSFLC